MARLVGEASVPTWGPIARFTTRSVTQTDAFRPLALLGLAITSIAGYTALYPLAPSALAGQTAPIALLMVALWAPYAAACWLILARPAPVARRWRRVELGILAGAALIFRAVVLPIPPLLSRDAYRYLWDAYLTAHGLSPYLHGPDWPGYNVLRDPRFYVRIPWSNVPTIYPPGAQLLYRVAYAIAPHNVWAIKGEMTILDLLAGLALVALLIRRRQDPRRAFIYLWAPLPIVEFALNGHVDAAAVVLITAALWANTARFRGARALVGFLIAAATLVKLYPIVLVLALARRRDWGLAAALVATLALGYAPYWREGWYAFGFLDTYLTQVHINYGGALLALRWLGGLVGANILVVQAPGVAGAAASVAVVVWLRMRGARTSPPTPSPQWRGPPLGAWTPPRRGEGSQRGGPRRSLVRVGGEGSLSSLPTARLGPLGASAALIVIWLAFSPHIFPWYAAALLPFCAATLSLPSPDWRPGAPHGLPSPPRGGVHAPNGGPRHWGLGVGGEVRPRRAARSLALGAWLWVGLLPLAYIAFVSDPYAWLYPAMYAVTIAVTLALLARGRPRLAARRPPRWMTAPWRLALERAIPSAWTARGARTPRPSMPEQPLPDDVPTQRAATKGPA